MILKLLIARAEVYIALLIRELGESRLILSVVQMRRKAVADYLHDVCGVGGAKGEKDFVFCQDRST